MISMKSEPGIGPIPDQNFKVVTHLYVVLVFINELHQSANFHLFLGYVIEIFLYILFLALFQRGPPFAPSLTFGGSLIFPPCPGISFLVLNSAFFPHTRLFPPSFFSVGGFDLFAPFPLFCCL